MDILDKYDGKKKSNAPDRMDISELIAAKRRNLKKSAKSINETEEEAEKPENDTQSSSVEESSSEDEKMGSGDDSSDSDSDSDDSSDEDNDEVDDADAAKKNMEEDALKTRAGKEGKSDSESDDSDSEDDEDEEEKEEAAKAAKFFDTETPTAPQEDVVLFAQLTLSRPLLRGIAKMGFVRPTPIQANVIPVALAGRDVCASAVTGSGKTAAFVLPIVERIMQRSTGGIKGVILTPTRELAAQCLGMMTTLAQFTKVRSTLIVGGAKNVNAQASELRTQPDVVVATPGRLLDHVTNSAGVTLDDVEFLVLDEADRLLDLGFQDEVHELVKACPVERQTLLFSATMTTKVDDLIKLSMKHPVRVKVSDKSKSNTEVEVAARLEQEFVRVRSGNEGINREGMLLALLTRTFNRRTIVFFDTKVTAHRLMILCGLCGIKCAELHGNLTQSQRLTALEQFRQGEVDILLATDLAARGLDIDSVETVVNFEMPSQVETYVHRIGRTARAGRGGKSCTLIGEGRRHLMKEVIKDAEEKNQRTNGAKNKSKGPSNSTGVIRSRTIPSAVVAHFVAKIGSLEPHVQEVLAAEAVARMDRLAEMEAIKAQNIIEHADEINSRPQREWFASNKQKQSTKEAAKEKQQMIAEKAGTGMHRMTRKKRRAREAREELERFQEETRREREESGLQPKKHVNEKTIKSSARAKKKQMEQKEKAYSEQSIHDEDTAKALKRQQKEKKQKKRKGAFGSDALGDSGLFDDEKVAFASKKVKGEDKPAKSNYDFKGYDPDKLKRKSKKKSVHQFKSKSKYKRR